MQRKVSNIDVIKYFVKKIIELKWYTFGTMIGVIIVTINSLIAPIFFKEMIDIIANSGLPREEILTHIQRYFWYFVGIVLFSSVTRRVLDYTIQVGKNQLDYNISLETFSYIHKHSYDFFINNFAGALNKKVGKLIGALQGLADVAYRDVMRFIVSFVFIIFVISKQNMYLGIGFGVYIVVFIVLSIVLSKLRVPYVEAASRENSRLSGLHADTITNNFNISLFGSLSKEVKYITYALNHWMRLEKKSTWVYIIVFGILSLVSAGGEILILYFTIHFWYMGSISVGTFVLILTYQMILSGQIFAISFVFGRVSMYLGNALEMLEILHTPHQIQDNSSAKNLKISSGKIEFKNIEFSYNHDIKVFEKFHLTIQSGEKIGIVGPSGSGKSSLIKLLFRWYDIQNGDILIDGQSISSVTQDTLRSQISLVPQDPILFHRSLEENIGYGKEHVDISDIQEASKKAHCHEFISQLKDGYKTFVGERGVKLSGGERQRVSIARAMLQNNKILVLDEATSALDSESEKFIQDALENLMKDKTMIVIAHRLSTIMKMDRIIVMDAGKIIEEGTHSELLGKSGVYKKLWDIQSGGFLGA